MPRDDFDRAFDELIEKGGPCSRWGARISAHSQVR